jgi:hypothetical protein
VQNKAITPLSKNQLRKMKRANKDQRKKYQPVNVSAHIDELHGRICHD